MVQYVYNLGELTKSWILNMKKRCYFTVRIYESLSDEINEYCKKNLINKSKLIEKLLENFLNKLKDNLINKE